MSVTWAPTKYHLTLSRQRHVREAQPALIWPLFTLRASAWRGDGRRGYMRCRPKQDADVLSLPLSTLNVSSTNIQGNFHSSGRSWKFRNLRPSDHPLAQTFTRKALGIYQILADSHTLRLRLQAHRAVRRQ
ncbi:hypothetical protein LX36DRAFT_128492 [Colletotrichum falcatum]|nr:hypothetical protein LX36DRAFT_128492 [Colletotrichum falcatum]